METEGSVLGAIAKMGDCETISEKIYCTYISAKIIIMVLSPTLNELYTLVHSSFVKNRHDHVVVDGFSFHNHYSALYKTYFSFFTKLTAKRAKKMVPKKMP